MPDRTAEEAARAHADATIAIDLGTTLREMTPEAMSKVMQLGNRGWTFTSYKLAPQGRDGGDYLFRITYATEDGPLPLDYRFREIDGEWRVVDIARA